MTERDKEPQEETFYLYHDHKENVLRVLLIYSINYIPFTIPVKDRVSSIGHVQE